MQGLRCGDFVFTDGGPCMRIVYTWLLLLERPKLVQQVPTGYLLQCQRRHDMQTLPGGDFFIHNGGL